LLHHRYYLGGCAPARRARVGQRQQRCNNTARELALGLVLTFVSTWARALAVWGAFFHLPPIAVLPALSQGRGHIWPAPVALRGGKGVATAPGALLIFDYNIVVLLALTFAILHLTNKIQC
jgi:glycerol-3-phosphate acyltransferase PlsY